MSSLMDKLTGGGNPNQPSLLGLLGKLPGMLSPGSQAPIPTGADSQLDPDTLANLQRQYQQQYAGAQAQAIKNGYGLPGATAMAAADAQSGYGQTVQNALAQMATIRQQQQESRRQQALAAMIDDPSSGFSPQQRAALSVSNPDEAAKEISARAFPKKAEGQPVPVSGGYVYRDDQGAWSFVPTKQDEKIDVLSDGTVVKVRADGGITRDVPTQNLGSAHIAGMKIDAASAAATAKQNTAMDPTYIQKVSQYQAELPSPRSANYGPVVAAASRLNTTFDASKYSVHKKALNDFGTGQNGNKITAGNNAIEHMDTLSDLGDQLGNGTFTPGNYADQEFSRVFGEPAPTNFDAIRHIVSGEIAKFIVPGQSAESDRADFAAQAATAKNPEVLHGIIQQVQRLFASQLHGMGAQYKRTTGYDDFNNVYLSPRTRQVLESFPDASQAKPSAASAKPAF